MKTPPLNTTRSTQIGIRMNHEERRTIEAAAKLSERKTSDWARLALVRLARSIVRRKAA